MSGSSIRWIVPAICVFLLLALASPPAHAQRFGKALSFAQIAFGGGYETVMNLSNRGSAAYNGSLTLLPSDTSKPFPALVNGNPVIGSTNIALIPGETATLRITSGDSSAGTVSGWVWIGDNSGVSPNLLEGNLTFYVKSADGTITDSVGVGPSTVTPQAVIPFDDFETVALALANPYDQSTTVKLALYDSQNVQKGTATQVLASNQQMPKFLYQYFPGVSLTGGRVEIQCDPGFLGTALTFVRGGQSSSLPILPSVKLYEVTSTLQGQTSTSHFYMTLEGAFVKAYTVNVVNGAPQPNSFANFAGVMQSGDLLLFGLDPSGQLVLYVRMPAFDPLKATQSGKITAFSNGPTVASADGTVTVTAIN